MPKTKEKKFERIDFKSIKFVFDNLSSEQMKAFDDNPPTLEEIFKGVLQLVDQGAKISIKYDSYSGRGYLATATFDLTGFVNSGYAISARGSDIEDCLGILCFKYFNAASEELAQWDTGKDEGFRRG